MRTQDADILIVPGQAGLIGDHWLERWHRQLKTARLVEQENWLEPQLESWCSNLIKAVDAATRPVVLVGHQCGVLTIAHAASAFTPGKVAGAYLVAPVNADDDKTTPLAMQCFGPVPKNRLPFPSKVIASRSNPLCKYAKARKMAEAWGSEVQDAGDVGTIDQASGHGPWPEGLMSFGAFLKKLG
ncbi:RBBP9/YdeN family alpha/beta hydrolase [Coralliovum pocilloporae]|uniref:RBBP9/YdeN family alpha/beta hydrolase n=1 Tax=Coralliovum pocilloporae TaxID=3066369 RepID=UPI003307590E